MMEEKTTIFMKISLWIKEKSSMNKFLFQRIHNKFHVQIDVLVILDIVIVGVLIYTLNYLGQLYFNGYSDYVLIVLISFIILFALYRIIEIIIYLFHAVLVSSEETILDEGRIILLIIFNYLEIIFWYAFFYRLSYILCEDVKSLSLINSLLGSLYYSVVTITSLGYNGVTLNNRVIMFLIASEALIGLYITVIIITRFISLLNPEKKGEKMKFEIEKDSILKEEIEPIGPGKSDLLKYNDRLIGACHIHEEDNIFEIERIGTKEHSKGYGTVFVKMYEVMAKEKGCTKMIAKVEKGNKKKYSFWKDKVNWQRKYYSVEDQWIFYKDLKVK